MSQLQNFFFESQEVRFVGTLDSPEWLAVDVCKILEIVNVSDTLLGFDDDEKGIVSNDTLGGLQGMLTVTIKAVGASNRDRLGDVRQAPLAVAV